MYAMKRRKHLRKLPKGQHASELQKKLAESVGIEIKDGFTFVSEPRYLFACLCLIGCKATLLRRNET